MGWQRKSTRIVYENNWMQVREDEVINPGGGRNQYGHVHFKNRAVAIIALDDQRNTWLVGQDRYTLDEYSWELPMGGAPIPEEPLVAARRELLEETGISAENWAELMRLHTSNSITDELGFVFIATGLTIGEPSFEETEDLINDIYRRINEDGSTALPVTCPSCGTEFDTEVSPAGES